MFSIVIPLFNKSLTIVRCINSILDQTFKNFEVLIVNDGSTDDSIEVIKNNFDDKRLVIINKDNGGVSSARNLGLLRAKFDLVAFIDADDTWEKDYLEKMHVLIRKRPNAALYGCRQNFIFPTGKSDISCYPSNQKDYVFNAEEYFIHAKKDIMFHASAVIVDKGILSCKGIKFDENLVKGEDLDFYFQIAFHYKMVLLNDALTNYYVDAPNSAMKKPCLLKKRLIGNIERYVRKGEKRTTREFFSEYILSCSRLLLNEYGSTKDVLRILSLIDVQFLPFFKKIYYYMPNFLKRYV